MPVFTDSGDLVVKQEASTDNTWPPTTQSCQPVDYSTDVISASMANSYSASDVCIQHETDAASGRPSSSAYFTAPSAQHLFQHSVSYPPYPG